MRTYIKKSIFSNGNILYYQGSIKDILNGKPHIMQYYDDEECKPYFMVYDDKNLKSYDFWKLESAKNKLVSLLKKYKQGEKK